ncbi:uncharacterized protein LOC131047635 [Cryptomeria japonica]|uniref:uncharacterized protein LOC131047635 n=1 Tax=Cryptomeria japonica TaxID=3369 RepID=UPI0027DA8899|nr:uncharacterized protein LOC131047635 [Cryptomeria japonica]
MGNQNDCHGDIGNDSIKGFCEVISKMVKEISDLKTDLNVIKKATMCKKPLSENVKEIMVAINKVEAVEAMVSKILEMEKKVKELEGNRDAKGLDTNLNNLVNGVDRMELTAIASAIFYVKVGIHAAVAERMAVVMGIDGCGKRGHGNGYRCAACNFDLHECCTTAPRVLHHSFHGANGIWVQFQKRPPGESQMRCSDCAQIVSGFGYYCLSGSCGYALHPTCALLLRPQTQVEVAPTRPTQVETPPPPPEKHHHHRGAAMAFRGVKFLGKLAVGAITGDPTSIGGALADLFLSD